MARWQRHTRKQLAGISERAHRILKHLPCYAAEPPRKVTWGETYFLDDCAPKQLAVQAAEVAADLMLDLSPVIARCGGDPEKGWQLHPLRYDSQRKQISCTLTWRGPAEGWKTDVAKPFQIDGEQLLYSSSVLSAVTRD